MDSVFDLVMGIRPTFEKATRNSYISATKDTFINLIYFVVAASVLGLISDLLTFFNLGSSMAGYLDAVILLIYSILGLLCCVICPRNLATHLNAGHEGIDKIDANIFTLTATICFCIFTVNLTGLTDLSSYGTEHITLALLTTFATAVLYRIVFQKVSLELPEGYPPNVGQYLKDLVALSACIVLAVCLNVLSLYATGYNVAIVVLRMILPIFDVFNSVWGLALIAGIMAMIWFSGVHDSSVVDPFIMGAALYFTSQNYFYSHIGVDTTGLLTPATRYFIMALGGTGATFVPCLMFKYMSQHRELREMGSVAWKPVLFGVNEPILYGAPLVQNKQFMIPFIAAPMVNVVIYALFVQLFGMGGFAYILPWFTPAPLGIILCAACNPLSIGLFVALLGVDFLIYLPFFKSFDAGYAESDDVVSTATTDNIAFDSLDNRKVLMLCAGGGTSGIIAKRMQKDADAKGINVVVDSGAYGSHSEILSSYDLILLAPQVLSYLPALKAETEELQVISIGLDADEYMAILETPSKGLQICNDNL